jgi:hypothetical protein
LVVFFSALEKGKTMIKKSHLFIPALLFSQPALAGPFTNPNVLGDLLMVMAPAYAFGMTMMENDYIGTIQLTEQLLAAQVTVEGIKRLELERRPNGRDYKSFPSGHAAGAFSGAMFVHKRYGWRPAVIPYAMAFATGWSRVHARAHYWHDVLGGALASALFTWVFVDSYAGNLAVNAGPGEIGLNFKTVF